MAGAAGAAPPAQTPPAEAVARGGMVDVDRLEAGARRAGLRVVAGERLVLATDRPPRQGDGVDDLPRIFAQAFAGWCDHYHIDSDATAGWRAFGCLMSDRERFRAAGLLPTDGTIPDFANGFCDRNRFWLDDQPNPAYRRHLLLHEGVHAFTLTLRSLDTPTWYTEGIAELLATHRLEEGRFMATPIPRRAEEVEQLGRVETIRRLRAEGATPGLADVFATPPSPRHDIPAYAANWAAAAFLAGHPRYAASFRRVEAGPLDARFTERLTSQPGWDSVRAARDFDAFTDELDHGFDFARSAVAWPGGRPLVGRERLVVKADRGWQPSGWTLSAGQRGAFRAAGRCRIGHAGDIALESEADGITLEYYRGRPTGRLLVAQWAAPAEAGRPRFEVIAEGQSGRFTAVADGVLYLKINETPGALADNEGGFDVELGPIR